MSKFEIDKTICMIYYTIGFTLKLKLNLKITELTYK